MTGLKKLKEAVKLIEDMTKCQFKNNSISNPFANSDKYLISDPYIDADRDRYLSVNIQKEADIDAHVYRIHFDVSLHTMGQPMTSADLLKLQAEAGEAANLLNKLKPNKYVLTPQEMDEFGYFIYELEQQREEQEKEQEQSGGPAMKLPGC